MSLSLFSPRLAKNRVCENRVIQLCTVVMSAEIATGALRRIVIKNNYLLFEIRFREAGAGGSNPLTPTSH